MPNGESTESIVGGLRAAIESLTREITSAVATLNGEIRSLREWRDQTSEDIHIARSTARLVERMEAKIERLDDRTGELEAKIVPRTEFSELRDDVRSMADQQSGLWLYVTRAGAVIAAVGAPSAAIVTAVWWLSRALPGSLHP